MAFLSLTYTFTNSTTADAGQMNTNFQDVVNALSDGTKDANINALTVAGTATFNGAIALGNATGDDITFTGSLASTIPIKTTATYNIGSATLGLAGVYLGNSTFTTKLATAATASYTLTLPTTAGTSGYFPKTDGSGNLAWFNAYDPTGFSDVQASAMGHKSYLADKSGGGNDTAYNGGNKATISTTVLTLSTVPRCVLKPYQTQDGGWWLKFNINLTTTAGGAGVNVAIAGVTFKTGGIQAFAARDSGAFGTAGRVSSGGTVLIFNSNGSASDWTATGDLELDSKPNWVY